MWGDDGEENEGAEEPGPKTSENHFDYELGDEDADGETDDGEDGFEFDDEVEGNDSEAKDPEALAKLLEQLRQAGALRDPGGDTQLADFAGNDEQVDWGDSADEE